MIKNILNWLNKKYQPAYVNWDTVARHIISEHAKAHSFDFSGPIRIPTVVLKNMNLLDFGKDKSEKVIFLYGYRVEEIKP